MKKLLIILLLLLPVCIFAQKTITGTVSSADDGSAMPGVSIINKSSSAGTITGIDGKYSIKANEGDELVFSFIGMSKQTVTVTGTTINVLLSEESRNSNTSKKNEFTEIKEIYHGFKNKPDVYSGTALPQNEYYGYNRGLMVFRFKPYLSSIQWGSNRNSFLNPVFGENLSDNVIRREKGRFFGVNFGLTFFIPVEVNITRFKSRFSYQNPITDFTKNTEYKGWEFSVKTDLGITHLPVFRAIVPRSYIGIGLHRAKIDTIDPYYADPDNIADKIKSPFWLVGIEAHPLFWFERTNMFSLTWRRFISNIGIDFQYKQSFNINKAQAFNGFSVGLTVPVKMPVIELLIDNIDFGGGSSGEGFRGDRYAHRIFGGLRYRAGFMIANTRKFEDRYSDKLTGYYVDVSYNHSKHIPLSAELGLQVCENYFAAHVGANISYLKTDNFSFDFGGGWIEGWLPSADDKADYEFKKPYYKIGATLMFGESNWGGINYSYIRAIGMEYPVPTHNFTYTLGRKPSKWITYTALALWLISLTSSN